MPRCSQSRHQVPPGFFNRFPEMAAWEPRTERRASWWRRVGRPLGARVALIYLVLAIAMIWAGIAWGQSPCATRADVETGLLSKYGEKPLIELKTSNGELVVVYMNPETESWTVYIIGKNGVTACVAVSGTGFKRLASYYGRGA